jgi:hypothetical protein
MNTIDINWLFHSLDQAQLLHWQTESYAEHSAYGGFYSSMIPLRDSFVETYMGKYGRVSVDPNTASYLQNYYELQSSSFILSMTLQVGELRVAVQNDTHLCNILDEMLAAIDKLAYLLSLS